MQSHRFQLEHVEIHAAHACNLTCDSCSHFSNSGHAGIVSLDVLKQWLTPWAKRLAPARFRIVGGEPTLNRQLSEIVRMVRALFPEAPDVQVVTNGFFLDRHPELGKVLADCRVSIHLSIHHDSAEYARQTAKAIELISGWERQYGTRTTIEPAFKDWTRRHLGFGADVLPYTDDDPAASWQACRAKYCRQIFDGRLWKCSPIAYLRLQKRAFPTLAAAWDPYLAYQPLDPACGDDELAAFLARPEEDICRMCPAKPERFLKPDPLIPRSELKADPGVAGATPSSAHAMEGGGPPPPVPATKSLSSMPQAATCGTQRPGDLNHGRLT